jgi:hypothetical protein
VYENGSKLNRLKQFNWSWLGIPFSRREADSLRSDDLIGWHLECEQTGRKLNARHGGHHGCRLREAAARSSCPSPDSPAANLRPIRTATASAGRSHAIRPCSSVDTSKLRRHSTREPRRGNDTYAQDRTNAHYRRPDNTTNTILTIPPCHEGAQPCKK